MLLAIIHIRVNLAYEEMDSIVKFVVGKDIEGWKRLDEEMTTASGSLAIADTSQMIWHSYLTHLVQLVIQRPLFIHMAGPTHIFGQLALTGFLSMKGMSFGQQLDLVG